MKRQTFITIIGALLLLVIPTTSFKKIDKNDKMTTDSVSGAKQKKNYEAKVEDVTRTMPKGALLSFSYSSANPFTQRSINIKLEKNGGNNLLTIRREPNERKKGFHFVPAKSTNHDKEFDEDIIETIEVADTVFKRVRDMVEEGKLYDMKESYYTNAMDASSWDMEFKFEDGVIKSRGNATFLDHYVTLNQIINYLSSIYERKTKKNKG